MTLHVGLLLVWVCQLHRMAGTGFDGEEKRDCVWGWAFKNLSFAHLLPYVTKSEMLQRVRITLISCTLRKRKIFSPFFKYFHLIDMIH